MPAYFNMSLVFRREDLYPAFVADLHGALAQAGLSFRSGFWRCETMTLPEITAWNQARLEETFRLGLTAYADGYRQVCFHCGGFSEVRGFWLSQCPGDRTFTFCIIVPEDDLLTGGWQLPFLTPQARYWAAAAEALWTAFPPIRSIQTGLEDSPPAADLDQGECPRILPFAVLPAARRPLLPPGQFTHRHLCRDGLLVLDEALLAP